MLHQEHVDHFTESLHFETDRGWDFNAGYPDFWRFKSRLVVPGGRVLDLGSSHGYNSLFFALHGMRVDAIDQDPKVASDLRKIAINRDLPFRVREEDAVEAILEPSAYDMVLLNDLLSHLHPKERTYELLDHAIAAMKPGSHLFVRTEGKSSSRYEKYSNAPEVGYVPGSYDFSNGGYDTARVIGTDTFEVECYHHGGHSSEIYAFYEQNELLFYFIHQGLRIVYANTAPSDDQPNVMFGEDARSSEFQYGFITLLGQKPA